MIEIDGSWGEGGGQVLRTALSLSLLTLRPVHIIHIRARRPNPGLQAQHLAAVRLAATVSHARVAGDSPGSPELTFEPGQLMPGTYHFDIGTAGASSLVLQTVWLPLALASQPSTITLTGGTHVPWSPCFHYLAWQWLPYLRKIGLDGELVLERAGFYPQGDGFIRATIQPVGTSQDRSEPLKPLRLLERGALRGIRGISAVANLNLSIAERQRKQALQRLSGRTRALEIEIVNLPSRFKGTLLLLQAEFRHASACYFGLGAPGKPAERVADEAVDALEEFLDSGAAIDQYLADQLLLPLAFAAGASEYRTARVTQHLLTNAWVIETFGVARIEVQGEMGRPGLVRIVPQV
jgi:RNA 3'-terminal phosphate cyclase (ATP)